MSILESILMAEWKRCLEKRKATKKFRYLLTLMVEQVLEKDKLDPYFDITIVEMGIVEKTVKRCVKLIEYFNPERSGNITGYFNDLCTRKYKETKEDIISNSYRISYLDIVSHYPEDHIFTVLASTDAKGDWSNVTKPELVELLKKHYSPEWFRNIKYNK